MTVKLLTEHRLEFLSLIGACTVGSESINVKIPHYTIIDRGLPVGFLLLRYSV